jgi:hypothetical protein
LEGSRPKGYFFVTPLNGVPSSLTPKRVCESRSALTHYSVRGLKYWTLFFTAPFLQLPGVPFFAIMITPRYRYEKMFSHQNFGIPFFKRYAQYTMIETALLSNCRKTLSSFRGSGLLVNGSHQIRKVRTLFKDIISFTIKKMESHFTYLFENIERLISSPNLLSTLVQEMWSNIEGTNRSLSRLHCIMKCRCLCIRNLRQRYRNS